MHPTVPPPPPAPLISHNHHIQVHVQKTLSGTVSCTNRAYARDTSRGLRVLCTSPAYARDRLVRDRWFQNSGFYTRQACAQVRLMHATLRYIKLCHIHQQDGNIKCLCASKRCEGNLVELFCSMAYQHADNKLLH